MRQPDFTVDPDELISVAGQANAVSDTLFHTVWKDERVGDDWLAHSSEPDDKRLADAMTAYRRSLRAATQRLADRVEQLGDGLRASADEYSRTDEANADLLPPPDPHQE